MLLALSIGTSAPSGSGIGGAAASCSMGGTSRLNEAGGKCGSSGDAVTRLSSSPTRSKTNMNICRSVADAVEATTGMREVERR